MNVISYLKLGAVGLLAGGALALPSLASANTVQCGNIPGKDVYKIAGPIVRHGESGRRGA